MITLEQYYMGRDITHPVELTEALRGNANDLLYRVNRFLFCAAKDGIYPSIDEVTHNYVSSGWRPLGVNARTQNAAANSRHIVCQAIDLQDDPVGRTLARWCVKHANAEMAACGLYMENPQWTPDWVHLQSVPPASRKRIFIPSLSPPLAMPLQEQLT